MDLFEAFRCLELETVACVSYNDYTVKDVEKCFRQQALKHHPDKGGDTSYFQLLQRAKCILLDHICVNGRRSSFKLNVGNDTNSTAVSTLLFEHKHRTCIRHVFVLRGNTENVIAATDDGLICIESKRDANHCISGGFGKMIPFATHRDSCFFLCCTACQSASTNIIYAGTKDGFVYRNDISTSQIASWQHPTRKSIVSISTVQNWVAIAIVNEGVCVLNFENNMDRPTIVWNTPIDTWMHVARQNKPSWNISPETILLERASNSNSLNLWIGGSDSNTGKLLMWELDIEKDLFERDLIDSMHDDFCEYSFGSSEGDSDSDGNVSVENAPAINMSVEEGPIYSLAKHDRTVAVTSGHHVLVWDCRDKADSRDDQLYTKNLTRVQTIDTNNQTLYTVCMNARFLAAAGSGESIMVWDRTLWSLLHYLPLQMTSSCCLATNCIMTLDWFQDDSGMLVSGGYDGIVTLWTLANRLK